ncbi:MAG TPA: signal peptidase II [Thermotogota bacterium]|nr:signal peptidase II [Thermotogota bacterium]
MARKGMRIALILLIVLGNVGCDRVTKHLAVSFLQHSPTIPFLNGTVTLMYAENPGAFLGMFSNLGGNIRFFSLILLPLVACVVGLYWVLSTKTLSRFQSICIAMMIGGGLGNLVDRVFLGKVVDFLLFRLGPLRTGIVNLADLSVFFGACGLVYSFFRKDRFGSELQGDERFLF